MALTIRSDLDFCPAHRSGGPRGRVFRGVGFRAEAGSLVSFEGPSGSGRTSLLLALSGRMRPTEGHATVGAHRPPRHLGAVRRISALAHVPGGTDLDPALTVGDHPRGRAPLQRRFGGSVRDVPRELLRSPADRRAEAERRVAGALAAAGLGPEPSL